MVGTRFKADDVHRADDSTRFVMSAANYLRATSVRTCRKTPLRIHGQ